MANKETAKGWFLRGLKPLASQFAQIFDWIRWKDESIAVSDVEDLTDILVHKAETSTINNLLLLLPDVQNKSAAFTYALTAGVNLEKLWFKSSGSGTLKMGTAIGVYDILNGIDYVAGTGSGIIDINQFDTIDRTVYISGINSDTLFYFFKR